MGWMSAEELEIARLNRRKKMLSCLRCGEVFRTDRCHRICSRCKELKGGQFDVPPALLSLDELLDDPRAEIQVARFF